jgi:glycosyltransferase involved in cell wall biosynthesis
MRPSGKWDRRVGRALHGLSDRRTLRRRRPPAIKTAPSTATPTIYYLCPDRTVPSGGIRAIYRHVDILNGNGRSAAVLHHSDGFACHWFEHSTRIVGAPSIRLSPDDTLVVPEIYGPFLNRLPLQPKLIAFNQNAYLTFEHLPPGTGPSYDIFESALTVSDDSADLLRFAFPDLKVSIVGNSIDPEMFYPAAELSAKRLAMMPRKRSEDAEQILRLLADRLDGWEILIIENASERETAAMLRSAPIFLALGKREGFGLPAAEAMACGCYVVGFTGFGGRDVFDPAFSKPVEDGDVLAAAREVAASLRRYERDPAAVREDGAHAAERIRERYSMERQARDLVAFYARLGCAPVAVRST